MTAEVVIDRLRTSLDPSAARSTVAALEPLARDYGRGILMVRSLRAETTDPQVIRQRVDDLRRVGGRPALGPVDPEAAAVFFADEAELLLCLSEDLLCGRAAGRWWWTSRLPAITTPEAALAEVWVREPRWVPLVVHELAQRHPARMIEMLRRAEPRQIFAVISGIEDIHLAAPATAERPVSPEPEAGAIAPDDLVGPARVLFIVAVTVALRPGEVRAETFRSWLRRARAAGSTYGPPLRSPSTSPPASITGLPDRAPATPTQLNGEEQQSDDLAEVIPIAPRLPDSPPGPSGPPPAWTRRPWEGSGTEVESEMATALYAVNLVDRLHLETIAAHQATGWAVVEAIIRRLLRDVPPRRRSALLADPLLPLLGELDTRPPGRPNPVRRGPWFRAVNTFLGAHKIDASAFTRPGRIVVSRTHVDVVLGIEEIDLAVRASGLDQDPGWAPYFGRVILFHFEDSP